MIGSGLRQTALGLMCDCVACYTTLAPFIAYLQSIQQLLWVVLCCAAAGCRGCSGNIALLDIQGKELWERHVKSMITQVQPSCCNITILIDDSDVCKLCY